MGNLHLYQAVIRIVPLDFHKILLEKDIAGIPLLKRLVFTLNRAGIKNITLLSQGLGNQFRSLKYSEIINDSRFKGSLYWQDLQNRQGNFGGPILNFHHPFLLVESNLVTTAKTIQEFAAGNSRDQNFRKKFVSNESLEVSLPGMRMINPKEDFSLQDLFDISISDSSEENPGPVIYDWKNKPLAVLVVDGPSANLAEHGLMMDNRSYYSQAMDIWANSWFALPLSRFLAKTSITPNQVTLSGLIIGLVSAYYFSLGHYEGQVLGGLLMVFSAIWDCCDGGVARFKFMESEAGETLDTICDNVINILVFTGMMFGVAKTHGTTHAMFPFLLLLIGGLLIFVSIYFPRGAKGEYFKGTWIYSWIQVLASRNFIYIVLVFALLGKTHWFLWLAGMGSILFSLILLLIKQKIFNQKQKTFPSYIEIKDR